MSFPMPFLDDHPCFVERPGPIGVQAFIPECPAETFYEAEGSETSAVMESIRGEIHRPLLIETCCWFGIIPNDFAYFAPFSQPSRLQAFFLTDAPASLVRRTLSPKLAMTRLSGRRCHTVSHRFMTSQGSILGFYIIDHLLFYKAANASRTPCPGRLQE